MSKRDPLHRLTDRESRSIARACRDAGWRMRKGGHGVIVYPPNGDPPVSIPATPQDHRALANLRRLLSRRGLEDV